MPVPAKRAKVTMAATLIVASALAACARGTGGECRSIPFAAGARPASTALALSCVLAYEANGISYSPWCAGVRPALLGERIGEARGGEVARVIEGVDPARAIAVRGAMEHECGTWAFTPAFGSGESYDDKTDLARTVVERRFLDGLSKSGSGRGGVTRN